MITAKEILKASIKFRYSTDSNRSSTRPTPPCPTPGCGNNRFYNAKKGYLQAYCQDCKQARDKAFRERGRGKK